MYLQDYLLESVIINRVTCVIDIDEAADKMTFATSGHVPYLWKLNLPAFLHLYHYYMANVRDIDRFSDEWNDVARDKVFKH